MSRDPFFCSTIASVFVRRFSRPLTFGVAFACRLVTREDAPVGSVINSARIGVRDAHIFGGAVRLVMTSNEWFDLRDNGSVIVTRPLDAERLGDESRGIFETSVRRRATAAAGRGRFQVTARFYGQTVEARVQIKIEDVDEFAPEFAQRVYQFALDAAAPAGTRLGAVRATDRDYSDRAGNLSYRAVAGNALGVVRLSRDGQLFKAANGYAFNRALQYSLLVQANGQGRKTVGGFICKLKHKIKTLSASRKAIKSAKRSISKLFCGFKSNSFVAEISRLEQIIEIKAARFDAPSILIIC